MKKFWIILSLILCFSVAKGDPNNWQTVESIFGKKGIMFGQVFKITFPRRDLTVTVNGIQIEPALALTSWAAFEHEQNGQVLTMGDLVLLTSEVEPVISKLIDGGIEITAIHNHLINEAPRIVYLHFSGHGDAVSLARQLKAALSLTHTPLTAASGNAESPIDWTPIESILGKGKATGAVFQISIPRREAINEEGMSLPPAMGVAHALNFQKIGNQTICTGDFILLANEVNPVIKMLKEHGIAATALHNHMLFETPRLFMLHFWGIGDARTLALSLKSAVNITR